MPNKKKKKGGSLKSSISKELHDFKVLLLGYDTPPQEIIRHILDLLKDSKHSEIKKWHLFNELLNLKEFQAGMRSIYLDPSMDIEKRYLDPSTNTTVDEELAWLLSVLKTFPEQLRSFVLYRDDIQNNMLLGENENSIERLNELVRDTGRSIWEISCLFSCLYFSGKDHELLRIRNNLPKEVTRQSETTILYEFQKARSSSTYDNYLTSLSRQSEDLKVDGLNDYEKFVSFKFNFDPAENYGDLKVLISGYFYGNIVDLYTFCLRILRYCYLHNVPLERSLKEARKLYDVLEDNELGLFLSKFDLEAEKFFSDKRILQIYDNYLHENFDEVIKDANVVLSENPSLSILYEVVAKSLLNSSEELSLTGPVKEIIICIKGLSEKKNIESNLKRLSKIFLNFKQFDWAYHLKAQIHRYSNSYNKEVSLQYNFADTTQVIINPFDIKTVSSNKQYVLENDCIDNYSAIKELIQFYCGAREQCNELSVTRYYKCIADREFICENFHDASKYYKKLLEKDHNIFCKEEITSKLIESLCAGGEFYDALIETAKALLIGNEASLFPLPELVSYISKKVKRNKDKNLLESAIIVLYFYNARYKKDVTQRISNISENLLSVMGYSSIEDITLANWQLNTYIITHILTIDVLDGFIRMFGEDEDLEIYTAKLKLCHNILDGIEDSSNHEPLKKHVLNDISSTFNRMVLYVCSSEECEGKILVDKESLKVLLLDELSEEFDKLYDDNLEVKLDGKLVTLNEELDIVTLSGDGVSISVGNILEKIFNEYTVNKVYGLDNSLNLGIRHGELVNHMWAPLKSTKLSGVRLATNDYDVDNIFDDYKLYDPTILREIKSKYANFLSDFEKLVIRFRNYCHVDSGEQIKIDNQIFFKYSIDTDDLGSFLSLCNDRVGLKNILEVVFDSLDKKTDLILREIKEVELPIFKKQISELFNGLLNDNENILPNKLQRSIEAVKSSTLIKVDELNSWFEWSSEPNSPFNLGAANQKAKDLVKSLYPDLKIAFESCESKEGSGCLFDSRFFTAFATIYSLIHENAVKHSGLMDEVKITDSYTFEHNSLILNFSNNVSAERLKSLPLMVEEINKKLNANFIDHASKDKGSGLSKVKSIIEHRVKLSCKVEASIQHKKFNLRIVVNNIGKLKYENTDC